MIRLFRIVVLICAGLSLAGCNASEKNEPIWQQVKITDLASSHSGKRPEIQPLKTINFSIYIFEIPAGNISVLDDVWPMLHKKPLRFNDYIAFKANLFLAGFGSVTTWNKIADLLRAAGAEKVEMISLLLFDGRDDNVVITRLDGEQAVFYVSEGGLMEGVTIGPGKLAWRIKAGKIPNSRGVCNVKAEPAFLPPRQNAILQLSDGEKSGEYLFTSAGFGLEMSPGDFVFFGPEKYIDHRITLAGLFFSEPARRPFIRTYLLVCTRIND